MSQHDTCLHALGRSGSDAAPAPDDCASVHWLELFDVETGQRWHGPTSWNVRIRLAWARGALACDGRRAIWAIAFGAPDPGPITCGHQRFSVTVRDSARRIVFYEDTPCPHIEAGA